ncbi:hypothetical protein K501DRAFT_282124 [Backusella circina FSU 941]|nr:hypothetical protein K501DRAFT_282124 [Backusella circina FSU 941]
MSIVPSSLRVVDLRKELSNRGLPTKGKKKDLVKRLDKALAEDPPTEVNETVPNASKEKPAEVASEQGVETVQEKSSDKPAEETIQQHVEPPPAEDLSTTTASIEVASEQNVEPTTDLSGNEPIEIDQQQQTTEPIIETPQPQTEKPINIILNNDIIQVDVIEQPNTQSIQQPSNEQVIEKPSEALIEIRQEQILEKPVEELIAEPLEELIEKPIEQLISNPLNQFLPMDQEEDHREAASMMAREQMVTPPKDDMEIKMSSTNTFDEEERGTKRKMDEELHEDSDKKQKISLNDNDSTRLLF